MGPASHGALSACSCVWPRACSCVFEAVAAKERAQRFESSCAAQSGGHHDSMLSENPTRKEQLQQWRRRRQPVAAGRGRAFACGGQHALGSAAASPSRRTTGGAGHSTSTASSRAFPAPRSMRRALPIPDLKAGLPRWGQPAQRKASPLLQLPQAEVKAAASVACAAGAGEPVAAAAAPAAVAEAGGAAVSSVFVSCAASSSARPQLQFLQARGFVEHPAEGASPASSPSRRALSSMVGAAAADEGPVERAADHASAAGCGAGAAWGARLRRSSFTGAGAAAASGLETCSETLLPSPAAATRCAAVGRARPPMTALRRRASRSALEATPTTHAVNLAPGLRHAAMASTESAAMRSAAEPSPPRASTRTSSTDAAGRERSTSEWPQGRRTYCSTAPLWRRGRTSESAMAASPMRSTLAPTGAGRK
mmetsp:Transcript_10070/g.39208  ORF Transcript_10070/g.39208 Transcript_10070/m.39208 type:complete len:424 (+) Transcript_10070:757-2028(+)